MVMPHQSEGIVLASWPDGVQLVRVLEYQRSSEVELVFFEKWYGERAMDGAPAGDVVHSVIVSVSGAAGMHATFSDTEMKTHHDGMQFLVTRWPKPYLSKWAWFVKTTFDTPDHPLHHLWPDAASYKIPEEPGTLTFELETFFLLGERVPAWWDGERFDLWAKSLLDRS